MPRPKIACKPNNTQANSPRKIGFESGEKSGALANFSVGFDLKDDCMVVLSVPTRGLYCIPILMRVIVSNMGEVSPHSSLFFTRSQTRGAAGRFSSSYGPRM